MRTPETPLSNIIGLGLDATDIERIADVLERYGVRWMVIFGDPQWVEGESRAVLQDVLAGTKTNLERLHLERISVPSAQAVYRVDSAMSDEQ